MEEPDGKGAKVDGETSHEKPSSGEKRSSMFKVVPKQSFSWKASLPLKVIIFWGFIERTEEYIIGTPEGAVMAYAVRPAPEKMRWGGQAVKKIKGTPRKPNPRKLRYTHTHRSEFR